MLNITDREFLAIKRIERITRNWYKNFKIEHKNNDIIFTMEQESQERFNEKREFHFVSKNGTEFCYHGYLKYCENQVVIDEYPLYPSGIILHIFAQVCDALDGLLDSYYIGGVH